MANLPLAFFKLSLHVYCVKSVKRNITYLWFISDSHNFLNITIDCCCFFSQNEKLFIFRIILECCQNIHSVFLISLSMSLILVSFREPFAVIYLATLSVEVFCGKELHPAKHINWSYSMSIMFNSKYIHLCLTFKEIEWS